MVEVRRISTTFEMKVSQSLFLPFGGIQFLLFRTRDSYMSSSLPSKYLVSLFLVYFIMSSLSSCMFGFVGVGVYFNPFSNNTISSTFNFLEDKLTI